MYANTPDSLYFQKNLRRVLLEDFLINIIKIP